MRPRASKQHRLALVVVAFDLTLYVFSASTVDRLLLFV
jgi:hypothetical protein